MSHSELFELHDQPWFPAFLRDVVTDALQEVWEFSNSYKPILPLLQRAMKRTGTREVLDLCSGGGGPWLRLSHDLRAEARYPVRVCLSDKYPNHEAFERAVAEKNSSIGFEARPVLATEVPGELQGFRTMFSSFHHFRTDEARKVLSDAAEKKRGIAIFEIARRDLRIMLTICFLPLLILFLTPRIRPFRWDRLLWTYVIPVVPFVLWFDGWMSCLRSYSQEELNEMVRGVGARGYRWETGTQKGGFLPVTYLIGWPEGGGKRVKTARG